MTREALAALLPHPTKVATVSPDRAGRCRKCSSRAPPTRSPRDPMDAVGGLVQTSGLRVDAST